MKLSTGKVAFPIEFDNGDKTFIYFNPNDKGIQDRIQNFEKSVSERVKAIDIEKYKSRFEDGKTFEVDLENPEKLLELSEEELKSLREKMEIVNSVDEEYNKAVRDELDVVFGNKISDVVFKYCQPFDIVVVEDKDGKEKREPYIMHFLSWLMCELKKYGVSNKTAMDKHLSKYAK